MPRALNVVGAIAALIAAGTVQVDAQAGRYPAARHGGNYMHNFYFPPAPSSTRGRRAGRRTAARSRWR